MKVLCLVLAILFSGNILACECVVRTLSDQYTSAKVIFLGEVINTKSLCTLENENKDSTFCGGPSIWLVRPIEVFKNPWNKLGNAKTGFRNTYIIQDGSDCQRPMTIGVKYLIFAKAATWDMYSTSQCEGPTDGSSSESTMRKLRKLKAAFEDAEKP